jgi:hypothetical protein
MRSAPSWPSSSSPGTRLNPNHRARVLPERGASTDQMVRSPNRSADAREALESTSLASS